MFQIQEVPKISEAEIVQQQQNVKISDGNSAYDENDDFSHSDMNPR